MPVSERKWREVRKVKQAGNSVNWSWLRSRLCREERWVKEAGRQVKWFLDSLETRIYFCRFGEALGLRRQDTWTDPDR